MVTFGGCAGRQMPFQIWFSSLDSTEHPLFDTLEGHCRVLDREVSG